MTSDDTLVSMLAVAASSRNSLFCKGKWGRETACAARDDASRYFSEGPFRILGLRFCRCVKKGQNRRRGSLILPELGGLLRSRKPGAKNGARDQNRDFEGAGDISRPSAIQPTAPAMPVRLAFGSTAIIASLPLLASFMARAEPVVLHKKTTRITYRNPGASRPLPSKTHRDTNLEGFFWRCL